MGRIIVTYNEVIDLNQLLEEKNLSFKMHLRDACGSQSFYMEPISNCSCEGRYEEMMNEVTAFFERKGISIRFLEDQLRFIIKE